ncbi:hypothetical protein BDV06DRAFT_218992 [Aspergillus oleicola]
MDVVVRSENMLREISAHLHTALGPTTPLDPRIAPSPLAFVSPTTIDSTYHPTGPHDQISNAILSQFHSSATESILAWPQLKDLHGLRQNHRGSVFHLESQRSPLNQQTSGVLPYVDRAEVEKILAGFEDNVNFWYPTLSQAKLTEVELRILSGSLDDGIDSCLTLLVLALGCASHLIGTFSRTAPSNESDPRHRWRVIGGLYFDRALKLVHLAQAGCCTQAVQCLFFTALYFAFLQRPVQAWSFISSAAIKCRLLLSYPSSVPTPEDLECLRRTFWSCYILESDYLSELSALPQAGIAEIESSIPLPGQYHTHSSLATEEQSSLYFLACISMRRLLNRVHDLLYAPNSGVASDKHQFPSVVAELDHQLTKWKDLLPPPFQFSVNCDSATSIEAGFLRQRYLACKSVIYRPYLTAAFSLASRSKPVSDVYEGCKICLDACHLHAQNLQGFPQTIMIDTWICSLSMASVMLIALATAREISLRECLPRGLTSLGSQLSQHLTQWMQIPGNGVSPSVQQSISLIEDAGALLQTVLDTEAVL